MEEYIASIFRDEEDIKLETGMKMISRVQWICFYQILAGRGGGEMRGVNAPRLAQQ
jgi:hypothetical protein